MIDSSRKIKIKPPRVRLTDQLLERLKDKNAGLTLSDLAKRTGLPYGLVYNILNKRVCTISARHYQKLFQEPAPQQKQLRIDGTYFRKMVELWFYLNDNITKTSLYREFYKHRHGQKIDYRIFSGKTETVDVRLTRIMETKFLECGIDRSTLAQWLDEYGQRNQQDRIPYSTVRPALMFMKNEMGVHPTSLLKQFFNRYEKGELKTISRKVFDRVIDLQKRSDKALNTGAKIEIERIKEEIYGEKKGYTLYAEIEDALRFLQKYAKKSPKKYLGRGTYMYEKGGCKRIPSWRAHNILKDCDHLIKSAMDLPLNCLPKSFQRQWIEMLRSVILTRAADMLSKADGIALEKRILSPAHSEDRYKNNDYGFTQFDRAPNLLGMKKAAFDLMVAKNCEIFRVVGRYAHRWYLSDLYLKELSENPYFKLVTVKYERLAGTMSGGNQVKKCLP